MKSYTFEQLPHVMAKVEEKLETIEKLLRENRCHTIDEEIYISAKEASGIIKMALATLYSKVCNREIPFYKRGNRLYFSKSELVEWIKGGQKKTFAEISQNAKEIVSKMERQIKA